MDDGLDFTVDVRDAYDDIAVAYTAERSTDDTDGELVARFLDELSADARVLDAGCGAGEPVMDVLGEHAVEIGLDFSRGQLSLAREHLPDGAFVQGEMSRLPFDAGVFDGIVAFYSVIHVPRERHAALFEEFHRVSRSGAPLLCTVGETDWTGHTTDWLGTDTAMQWDIPGLERTRRLLREAGFVVEGVDRVLDDVTDGEASAKPFVWARA